MHIVTDDELKQRPERVLDDAARGEPSLVTEGGVPVMLAVPLGAGLDATEVRTELAARLFDHEQISLGLAASIAGLSYGEMVDQLGLRGITVIRTTAAELERELAAFGA